MLQIKKPHKSGKTKMTKTVAPTTFIGVLFLAWSLDLWANSSGVPVPKLPTFNKSDAKAFGLQLAKYADSFDTGWKDQFSKSTMRLFDARGDSVDRKVTQTLLEGSNGDKSMVRFMSPAEIRGVGALVHENPAATDDSWLYLPSNRKVSRVSGANRTASFQGTEFTYEDLSTIIVRRYDWRFLGEDSVTVDGTSQKVYKVEAKPTYKDTGYSKLVIFLNQNYWRAEKMAFYDKAGQSLKTLSNSKWQQLHGRFWRAYRTEMANHQTKKRTVIEIKSLFLNLSKYKRKDGSARKNLTDQHFTKRSLEK